MTAPAHLARALAATFLSTTSLVGFPEEVEELLERASTLLGKRWRWLRPLVKRFIAEFAERPTPRIAAATLFIENDRGFQRACATQEFKIGRQAIVADQQGTGPGRAIVERSRIADGWRACCVVAGFDW